MVIIGGKEDNGQSRSDNCYSVQARNDSDGDDCDKSSINYRK
jgi:hypothetical protein